MDQKHNENIQQIYLYAKSQFKNEEYIPTYFTLKHSSFMVNNDAVMSK